MKFVTKNSFTALNNFYFKIQITGNQLWLFNIYLLVLDLCSSVFLVSSKHSSYLIGERSLMKNIILLLFCWCGTPAQNAIIFRQHLNKIFPNRRIGTNGVVIHLINTVDKILYTKNNV